MKKLQANRISSCNKRKKCSFKCRDWDSNLEPLVYEASALSTELSFRMKSWEKVMTIYIWFVVQQMYDSLTYPFSIVQYTLSHIVEHRKLDSLATPDNIVWSTVTSCWTNNVRQFDPSHALQSICTLSRSTFATHFDKHGNHQCFVREEVSNSTVDLVNEFYEF